MKLQRFLFVIVALTITACSSVAQSPVLPTSDLAAARQQQAMGAIPIGTPSPSPGLLGGLLSPVAGLAGTVLPVCGITNLAGVSCTAIRRTDILPVLDSQAVVIQGYHPADLQRAYQFLSANSGGGQTIGIVIAFDDPTAEADLATYRARFALPACTSANGCFRKVGESGSSNLPAANEDWAQEASIDLDMASAVCPNCHLLLVEAGAADLNDLASAVNTAVAGGASVVSNSYAAAESAQTIATNPLWNHPGVPIVAGTGDSGSGVFWPAASSYVTAVGGTTLTDGAWNSRGFSESAWSNASGGCSALGKPAWQSGWQCSTRMVADVSAVADPQTGVAVYDTYVSSGSGGWMVFGGTSVATPIVAGAYALAGNGHQVNDASYVYAHAGSLNAVSGSTLKTGLGSPKGAGAF